MLLREFDLGSWLYLVNAGGASWVKMATSNQNLFGHVVFGLFTSLFMIDTPTKFHVGKWKWLWGKFFFYGGGGGGVNFRSADQAWMANLLLCFQAWLREIFGASTHSRNVCQISRCWMKLTDDNTLSLFGIKFYPRGTCQRLIYVSSVTRPPD